MFSAMCAWVLFANLQANLSPFRCIPHYVTQRDVECNNCSLEQVIYARMTRYCKLFFLQVGATRLPLVVVSYPDPYFRSCGWITSSAAAGIRVWVRDYSRRKYVGYYRYPKIKGISNAR